MLLARLLAVALSRGTDVVATFDPSLPDGGFPTSQLGVTAVSDEPLAVRVSGVYIAPGHDVPTTQPGARWYLVNGSSYAAAHASGLFALLRAARPKRGAIDACASLLHMSGPCDCLCAREQKVAANMRP